MDKFRLVLIETSGNQQYIFSTNKLRENVGASELTYRVGTQWTLNAVHKQTAPHGGQPLWPSDGDSRQLRLNLLNPKLNPPLGSPGNQLPVEVIIATSGKALLLVSSRDVGRAIISDVTATALELAPGLDVCGVISDEFDWKDCPLGNVITRIHEMFEETRAQRPGPALRFLRLPVVDECASSGLPAKKWHEPGKNDEIEFAARSAVTLAKWDFRNEYSGRMNSALKRHGLDKLEFARNVDQIAIQLEEQTDWLGIVHADGNGLGQIFLKFGKHANCGEPDATGSYAQTNRDYVDRYRHFSLALDICTERAFMNVINRWVTKDDWVPKDKKGRFRLPMLPIVLGGDDLTIVCDGHTALPFAREFLIEFEAETERKPDPTDEDYALYQILQEVAKEALGAARLSSCAGVSVVKSHYPFSGAYEIAEDLIQSAKQIKNIAKHPQRDAPWPVSALDFHLHYDTSGNDLEDIRQRLTQNEPDEQLPENKTHKVETRLYGRPYVVSDAKRLDEELTRLEEGAEQARAWIAQHHWDRLQDRVDKLVEKEDGRRVLPNSQTHDLRAGLFLGRKAAEARYELIRHRYDSIAVFEPIFEKEVVTERPKENEMKPSKLIYITKLLDALDVATLYDEDVTKAGQKAAGNGGKK